ncbi:MAG TPA: hypothetical protein VM686_19675 [Polyangiaceae bacterium]|nr:hypothetical protein [Polyangiaceae bacterium]
MRSLLPILTLGLLSVACGEGGHGGIPGEELGTYGVVGTLSSSSCGPDALGATDPWQFEVRLSKADRELFWLNGREAIAGRLSTDGVTFEFETRVEVEALPAERGRKACVVSRSDQAQGVLSAAAGDVLAFSGELAFGYSVLEDSDCSPLVGVTGGFAALPCSMAYALQAARTKEPERR